MYKVGCYDLDDLRQEHAIIELTTPPQFVNRRWRQRLADICRHETHCQGRTPPRKPYKNTGHLRYPQAYHDLTDNPPAWIITESEALSTGYGYKYAEK